MRLHFGTRITRHPLPEPAYGVSRYELDRLLLLEHAASAGAQVVCEHWSTAAQGVTVILAAGRRSIAPSGDRLFGFKATSAAPSTTTWNSTSFKIATSESAPSKTAPPTFAVSLRSEASVPSAFTPAISSIEI